MIFDTFDVKKIYQMARKVSEKVLVQVEGPTCSGKTSFVSDIYATLKRKGIDVMVIEEAATRVLRETDNLLEQLVSHSSKSNQWRKAKIELQRRVLFEQIEGLERFAENDEYGVALMDRGGASTAYHTIPLLSDKEKEFIEGICREIGKMGSQIILLSPPGFLDRDSSRYQKTFEEVKMENRGIKYYLDRWKLNCLEIPSVRRAIRVRIGIRCILDLLNDTE